MIEAPSATGDHAASIEMKAVLVDLLRNVAYSFAVRKYIPDELKVNKSALRCAEDVVELLPALEVMP